MKNSSLVTSILSLEAVAIKICSDILHVFISKLVCARGIIGNINFWKFMLMNQLNKLNHACSIPTSTCNCKIGPYLQQKRVHCTGPCRVHSTSKYPLLMHKFLPLFAFCMQGEQSWQFGSIWALIRAPWALFPLCIISFWALLGYFFIFEVSIVRPKLLEWGTF